MLFTRKIGKILRGNATPYQIFMACFLGSILGFIPDFQHSAGLTILTILLILILNANIGLALSLFAITKLLSYILTPLNFKIGEFLLNGQTKEFFNTIINSPVFAFFGFEYYLTTGSFFTGIVFGIFSGILIVLIVNTFRKTMVKAEEKNSAIFKISSSFLGKTVIFIVFGKGEKQDYEEILSKKAFPFRLWGIAIVFVFVLLFFLFQNFLAGNFIKKQLKSGLEQANGATVDIKKAYIELSESRFIIEGLQICDPEKPDTNLFEAEKIVADISTKALLTKRLRLDNVEILGAETGSKRKEKGKLFKPIEVKQVKQTEPYSLEQYLANAKELKRKLQKFKRWYRKISESAKQMQKYTGKEGETLEERLKREAESYGYKNVVANHLIEKYPLSSIGKLKADNIKTYGMLKNETLSLFMRELSTNPNLLETPPEIHLKSSKNTLKFDLILKGLTNKNGDNTFTFSLNNLNTDDVLKKVKLKQQYIREGKTSIKGNGKIFNRKDVEIDAVLNIELNNCIVKIPELGEEKIEKLTFPVYLSGVIDNPKVKVDTKPILKEIKKAFKDKAKRKLKEKKKKAEQKLKKKLRKKIDKKKSKWKNLF